MRPKVMHHCDHPARRALWAVGVHGRCGGALGGAKSVGLNKFPIFFGTNRKRDMGKKRRLRYGGASLPVECS